LAETIIELEAIDPLSFFGANDSKLQVIQKHFPKLKLIARGRQLKVMGEEDEVKAFTEKINALFDHFNKYNSISVGDIDYIFAGDGGDGTGKGADVIVFGNSGLVVKARTRNQRKMVESINKHDMLFAIGPAGTGKTYTAVALAVRALRNKEIRRIVLTRPAVEAGENLGFLPGDLKEKLDPYLRPLYDALRDMLPPEKLAAHMESGVIEIAPLAFMRGRTLDNAFVILDEAQNATHSQLKMFLTRMGRTAKFIITGDVTQIDLPKSQPSGLIKGIEILRNVQGIDFIFLDDTDVIRHPIVKNIIEAYDKNQPK
jgi:phosphate starvation-inducible protein PhoH and related proteins